MILLNIKALYTAWRQQQQCQAWKLSHKWHFRRYYSIYRQKKTTTSLWKNLEFKAECWLRARNVFFLHLALFWDSMSEQRWAGGSQTNSDSEQIIIFCYFYLESKVRASHFLLDAVPADDQEVFRTTDVECQWVSEWRNSGAAHVMEMFYCFSQYNVNVKIVLFFFSISANEGKWFIFNILMFYVFRCQFNFQTKWFLIVYVFLARWFSL